MLYPMRLMLLLIVPIVIVFDAAADAATLLKPTTTPSPKNNSPTTSRQLTGRQLLAIAAPPPPLQAAVGAYGYPPYGVDKRLPPVPPVPYVASLPPRIDPLLGQEFSYGLYPYGEYGGFGYGYRPYYSGYNYPLWGPFGPPPEWFYVNDKYVGNL